MKRILTLAALALSLAGGVASADRFHEQQRPPAKEVREVRVYRDVHRRPPIVAERMGAHRRGFEWIRGDWQWSGHRWTWVPGHYARAYRR